MDLNTQITPVKETYFIESPALIIFFLLVAVFASETSLMLLFRYLPIESQLIQAVADAAFLILFISPVLYFLVYRPMNIHIRERKKIEEALFKSQEDRLKALIRTSMDGFLIVDRHGRFLEVNDAYCQMTDYSREELLCMGVSDVEAIETAEDTARHIEEIIEHGRTRFETQHRRKDGSIIDVEVSANCVSPDSEEIYSFYRDITVRKASEAKLERMMRLHSALSQCNQTIVRCSSEEELFQQVCRDAVVLGGLKMAWVGMVDPISQMVKPVAYFGSGTEYLEGIEISADENKPSGRGPTGIVIRENRAYWCQDYQNEPSLALWRKRGKVSGWAASAALPLLRNDVVVGTLNLYAGVVNAFDESEQNLLEGMATDISYALTRFSLQAERKLAEAEREQLQAQLLQAQKMESIGHLTAGIAHDFNNILAAMMGYTELSLQMIASGHTDTIVQHQEKVLMAGNRARELIQNMLMFSRISNIQKEAVTPVILLAPVIKEVCGLLRSSITSSIDINYHIAIDDLKAQIDPISLHQIILNLVVNARDATGESGNIDISLSRQHYENNLCSSCKHLFSGDYIQITVKDSGSGIPEHVMKNMFDPFYTTKDVGKGSGMGLSVVHGLVHTLNGHIYVDLSSGMGTAINIMLPLAASEINSQEGTQSTPETNIKGIRIMIVDDEVILTSMLKEILSSHGAEVSEFNQPALALEYFIQHADDIDLVITDESMPVISGMQLAERLLEINPSLSVILCTGYSEHATAESIANIGIAGIFNKPVKTNDLLQKIQQLHEL